MIVGKGEGDRYLKQVLDSASSYADTILILEDKADKRTIDVCKSYNKVKLFSHSFQDSMFGVDESSLRDCLWEVVRKYAQEGDWIISLDADEIFDEDILKVINMAEQAGYGKIACKLLDMWDKKHYRIDGYWSPSITRIYKYINRDFGIKGNLHCGCVPTYTRELREIFVPRFRLRHLGWQSDEDKKKKMGFYVGKASGINLEHALTIDKKPTLIQYSEDKKHNKTVTIASLIKNREWCLKEFLAGLEAQTRYYDNRLISFFFIVNDSIDRSQEILNEWKESVSKHYANIEIKVINFKNTDSIEHHWGDNKLRNMAYMRDLCMQKLKNTDYLFMLDSDVILTKPDTLMHLVALQREVVYEVFWAGWENDEKKWPQVWQSGGYELTEQFIRMLKIPGVYEVGMGGACSLFYKSVLEKGANYKRVRNLPREMRGEDRDMGIRLEVLGIKQWADTYKTPIHYERTKEQKELDNQRLRERGLDIKENKEVNLSEKENIIINYLLKKKKDNPQVKISLCMMVKNEEKYIEGAILSVLPLVDEVVVVDTGSTDKTKEILKKYNAKIIDYKWNDDFSEPRNIGLRACTGNWILRLDADERIELSFLPQLFDNILGSSKDVIAFLNPIRNYFEDPSKKDANYFISETCRLFKNRKDIFYSKKIHEEIDSSLQEIAKGDNKVIICRTSQYLTHLGYMRDKDELKKKHEKYAEISIKQLETDPNDASTHYSLGTHFNVIGDKEKAFYYYSKAVELNPNFSSAWNDLGVHYFYKGCFEKAKEMFVKAKETLSPSANQALKKRIEINLEDIDQVEKRFKSMMIGNTESLKTSGVIFERDKK